MTQEIASIMASVAYGAAVAVLDREHDRIVEDIIRLTEIASPPFGEDLRGDAYLAMLRAHGLADVEKDAVGNVMGLRRGIGNGPLIVVAAHLDTVFPEGTNVTVRREGTKLFAPGIGDDTRSLAVLLGFMRALDEAGVRTVSDILFVGDVGEEGLGDLRGIRHLFHEGKYKDRIKAFFTVDSPDMTNIATSGIGSRRWRVTFRGPGGHSYGAFGLVSPMNAMAQAIADLARVRVPAVPKTTYSASVIGGGTSVNAIPNEVWLEVDLRSAAPAELARLEKRFLAILDHAVEAENHARSTAEGEITVMAEVIGDRPAGSTDVQSDIVRHATAAIEAHGFRAKHVASSTDANIPMALGIPAIKIGSGGTGGRAHSLGEWIDVEKEPSLRGMAATLTAILAVAGVSD
jgi:acetylornithine deacetylase/succinyl-diaminopimelate desuccinylase-like protein